MVLTNKNSMPKSKKIAPKSTFSYSQRIFNLLILGTGCTALAFLCVLWLQLPFIGLIPMILAIPVIWVFPQVATTGSHVEYGFAWIIFKTHLPWVIYFCYYFVLFILIANFRRKKVMQLIDRLKKL